uniref:ABC-type xenobiotic transporter n=1 Tax=Heliothis virescens TaxID=7102 RepID=A0A2A4JRP4_HELVI
MKRDDSTKSFSKYPSQRRVSGGGSYAIAGWRHNSLTINSLAQNSAYLAEKLLNQQLEQEERERAEPVAWHHLYRYAKPWEIFCLIIGVFFACINGLFVPLGVIIYGEFTALLIDRTVMVGTSTETWSIAWFGGGKILTNASREANRIALIQDSQAFGVGCTVFSIGQFIVGVISVDIFNYMALRQVDRLKAMFLRAVLRQDITWYDLNTTMNFATKVSDDIEKFREGIAEKVPIFIYLVMSFVTSVLISFAYGWELTLVILSATPVVIATTAVVAKVQSSLTSQELKAYSIAGVVAEEVLSAIRTVVAFGGQEKEIDRYARRLEPAKKMGTKKGIFAGLGSGVMWFIIYATYALAFWYGVGLILDSREEEKPVYTAAVLMIVFFSVLQGAQNVGLTAPHMEAISTARASAASVYSVIDRKPLIDIFSPEGERPELTGDIEFKDVYFRYPARSDVQVLNGLNLKINANETVALVGSSGCGKSTVLQLIQRMYDPDAGSVTASGNDLRNMNVRHYRNHIAVVGQEPVLFAGTIKDNIKLSNPEATDEDVIAAAKAGHCHDFIKTLPDAYNTFIGERGAQLSGGQKQRIAIARALVRKPKILLLDEATSALDSQSEAKVQRALDSAAAGRTTVMVSHRLSTVLNANRIVFIDKGEVVEEGTHSELMAKKGRFYQLAAENEAAVDELTSDPTKAVTKRTKIKQKPKRIRSIESVQSIESESSSSSDSSMEEVKEEEEFHPTNWQILKLCGPEKWLMIAGVLSAIAVGSSFPTFAILFGETYGYLESPDNDWVRGQTNVIAILFLLVGIYTGVGIFFQIFIFNLTGVRLTARLRVAAFESMLKQEIGWFDDTRNGVGALSARLASDAAAVQGVSGEEGVMERYHQAFVGGRLAARKSLRWRGCVFSFGQTAPVAGYALALWYGGVLVANGEIPYKNVIKVSEALIFGAWMMGQALAFAPNFGAAVSAAGRVMTLLARKPLVADTTVPSVHKDYVAKGKIDYNNIKFRYPTRREVEVLRGLSVIIPSGKRVALVGPSGCGKSTLIQLIQRLYDPDEGTINLDDHNIVSDMRLDTLRRNIGLVSQEPVLFDRTIAENIAYGDNKRVVTIEEIVTAAKQANVHSFIAALPNAYETRVGARASQLSGGQKQRIAIARALVRNPRVLLLDEATSALDTHSEKIVQEALDRASEGRTSLIIAHRLQTIQNADVIIVISKGVVAEKGTHKELIAKRGIYARLYELQCGIPEEADEVQEE